MKIISKYWVTGVAFLLVFFAVGIPYWQIPYNKVSLPNSLYGSGLMVIILAAMLARAFSKAPFMVVVLVIGAAVTAVVCARVSFDTMKDPTSHNLWPFEVVLAGGVGGICALAGALLGSLFTFLFNRLNPSRIE